MRTSTTSQRKLHFGLDETEERVQNQSRTRSVVAPRAHYSQTPKTLQVTTLDRETSRTYPASQAALFRLGRW